MVSSPRRINFLDCPIDLFGPDEILARAEAAALGEGPRLRIEGLNVAKLIDARSSPALKEALADAELVHIDGRGILLGLSALGIAAPQRAGIDLVGDLCGLAARRSLSVYLLGARAEVVADAGKRLVTDFPTLTIAGFRDGYFTRDEEPAIVQAIAASGAAFLFIGISSPKKEVFLRRNWDALGVAVGMGVGGSFDVLSGRLPRAPIWMQRCSLEWLFRLALEPRRLAWRYLRTNVIYVWLLAKAWLGPGQRREAT